MNYFNLNINELKVPLVAVIDFKGIPSIDYLAKANALTPFLLRRLSIAGYCFTSH